MGVSLSIAADIADPVVGCVYKSTLFDTSPVVVHVISPSKLVVGVNLIYVGLKGSALSESVLHTCASGCAVKL